MDDYLFHKLIQKGSRKFGKFGVTFHKFDKLVSPHAVRVVSVNLGLQFFDFRIKRFLLGVIAG